MGARRMLVILVPLTPTVSAQIRDVVKIFVDGTFFLRFHNVSVTEWGLSTG